MFLKLFTEVRFEPVCLTCQGVFKGPNAPPVPTLPPVSQIGLLFLFLNLCPSAALLSLSFSWIPSWTWSIQLLTLTSNKMEDTFKDKSCHFLWSADLIVLLCTFTCEIEEGGSIVLTWIRSIFGLGMNESAETIVCLLPLSESSLLLGCLLLFIFVCSAPALGHFTNQTEG